MSVGLSTRLRVALSRMVEAAMPVADAAAAARASHALECRGMAATLSYFPAWNGVAAGIIEACAALSAASPVPGTCLAIKASPLYFDKDNLRAVAEPASAAGMTVVFDALTHAQAGQTMDLAEWMAGEFPSVGVALPARWQRSTTDAARFRDAPVRIRLVKGEWADPQHDPADVGRAYLDLARLLAGRAAPVGVATHDPELAEAALRILLEAGTPCELEQLRGLPGRRTRQVARALGQAPDPSPPLQEEGDCRRRWRGIPAGGYTPPSALAGPPPPLAGEDNSDVMPPGHTVPVRLYWPFGPGWWPYAAEKLLERPYLPWWWVRDRIG